MPGVLRGVAGHTQTRSQHSWSRAGREVECRSWSRTEGSQRLEVGEMLLPRNLARLLHHQEAGGLEGEDLRLLCSEGGEGSEGWELPRMKAPYCGENGERGRGRGGGGGARLSWIFTSSFLLPTVIFPDWWKLLRASSRQNRR